MEKKEYEMCRYSFSQNCDLNVPAASVHEGNKPFKCDFFKYTCSQKGDMKRHITFISS